MAALRMPVSGLMASPVPAPERLPQHLAIIMDGNGRWAQQRQRPRLIGHRAGARAVNICVEFCLQHGIRVLTLFAFSSENWNRPAEEVGGLMKLFLTALDREVAELHRLGVRIRFIGERDRFADGIRSRMAEAEARTLAFLREWVPERASPMCGNSICQDRRFLHRQMPALERHFHYRNLDVSTIKELARRWAPQVIAGFHKESAHTALSDVRDSIDELRHYRRCMGELAGGADTA